MSAIPTVQGVRWKLQLVGEEEELRGLARMFGPSAAAGLRVWFEDGRHYLHAPEFESMTTAGDVLARGEILVGRLNGLGFLKFGVFRPVETGNVMQPGPHGGDSIFVMAGTAVMYVPSVALLTYLGEPIPALIAKMAGPNAGTVPAPPPVERWDVPERFAVKVDEALSLLAVAARSEDWRLLVFIYEIIEGQVDPPQPSKVAKVLKCSSQEEIGRFRDTANDNSGLGTKARHGRQTRGAPPNPMTFPEARAFVRRLLLAWVQYLSKHK